MCFDHVHPSVRFTPISQPTQLLTPSRKGHTSYSIWAAQIGLGGFKRERTSELEFCLPIQGQPPQEAVHTLSSHLGCISRLSSHSKRSKGPPLAFSDVSS